MSYVRRGCGCELHQKAYGGDKTSLAAAASPRRSLPICNGAGTTNHKSIEAALHRLVPLVADIREDLHDGLCVIYDGVPPADARERRVIDAWYRQVVIKLGHLLVRSRQLAKVGMQSPMTGDEFWFVARARNLNASLFEGVQGDRAYMLEFMRSEAGNDFEESAAKLLSAERGQELYNRWVEWVESCYPTCAFERSTSLERMCSPHTFLTLLYEIESRYLELGFRDLELPETSVIHHRLLISSTHTISHGGVTGS